MMRQKCAQLEILSSSQTLRDCHEHTPPSLGSADNLSRDPALECVNRRMLLIVSYEDKGTESDLKALKKHSQGAAKCST